MKFGLINLTDAEGCILAHSLRFGKTLFPKGRILMAKDIAALQAEGIEQVTCACLDADDLGEDKAAKEIGKALCTKGILATDPVAGRVNLIAEHAGVLQLNTEAITAMNGVDEALTLATLPNLARVEQGTLLATIKVIPYGAPRTAITQVVDLATADTVQLHPFKTRSVDLILTRTDGFKDSLISKGKEAVENRVENLGLSIGKTVQVEHTIDGVASAISHSDAELILILGASATSDRKDVIPAAVTVSGGTVLRFGMPVDPGNLMVLGQKNGAHIVGLPGCARAPSLNGVDWVLERLVAGINVGQKEIARMGVGGLLKETPQRVQPRMKSANTTGPKIGLLLAAGSSRRMKGKDKLLQRIDGETLLRRSARAMQTANVDQVFVALKSDSSLHKDELSDLDVTIVEVPNASTGMSASLRAGVRAISSETSAILVGLADMPEVTTSHYNLVLSAHDPDQNRLIICPVTPSGKRGHPVLFDTRFRENLCSIEGDQGARDIIKAVPEAVFEMKMPDEAVICDLDTPEMWDKWRERQSKG